MECAEKPDDPGAFAKDPVSAVADLAEFHRELTQLRQCGAPTALMHSILMAIGGHHHAALDLSCATLPAQPATGSPLPPVTPSQAVDLCALSIAAMLKIPVRILRCTARTRVADLASPADLASSSSEAALCRLLDVAASQTTHHKTFQADVRARFATLLSAVDAQQAAMAAAAAAAGSSGSASSTAAGVTSDGMASPTQTAGAGGPSALNGHGSIPMNRATSSNSGAPALPRALSRQISMVRAPPNHFCFSSIACHASFVFRRAGHTVVAFAL